MMLGYQASFSETSCDFFLFCFVCLFVCLLFQSDRPTQYQETYSTLNGKKGGMAQVNFTKLMKAGEHKQDRPHASVKT